jgi:hypothetical protein
LKKKHNRFIEHLQKSVNDIEIQLKEVRDDRVDCRFVEDEKKRLFRFVEKMNWNEKNYIESKQLD